MANKKSSRSRRAQRKQQAFRSKKRQRWFQAAAALIVLSLALGVWLWPRPASLTVSQERLQNYPVLGNPEASIVITEFGDFACHGCQAWHEAGIRDNIIAFYGDEVAFVWRDFPIITSRSPKAAQAGQCAHDQGQFWAYHDHVYENGQRLSETSLKTYAADIGLDMTAFDQCLDSNKYQRMVDQSIEDARQLRLRGTPSFIVNGQPLAGPPPFRYLADLIDQELANTANN